MWVHLYQWRGWVISVNLIANEEEHVGPCLLTLIALLDKPLSKRIKGISFRFVQAAA
jgi:hypothetical protein